MVYFVVHYTSWDILRLAGLLGYPREDLTFDLASAAIKEGNPSEAVHYAKYVFLLLFLHKSYIYADVSLISS